MLRYFFVKFFLGFNLGKTIEYRFKQKPYLCCIKKADFN